MIAFRENRWRTTIPWMIFLALLMLAQVIPIAFEHAEISLLLWIGVVIILFQVFRKLLFPRAVVSITSNHLAITGVIPGWWKLFQRWQTVVIPIEHIINIRVGKIRERQIYGVNTPPLGEPSRGGHLQNFLWVSYMENGNKREIYYPHINDIRRWSDLVETLQRKFPAFLK